MLGHNLKNKLGLLNWENFDNRKKKNTAEVRLSILKVVEREDRAVVNSNYQCSVFCNKRWFFYSTPVLSDHQTSFLSLVRIHCKPLFVPESGSVKADLQVACHSLDGFRIRRYLCLEWKRAMQHIRTIQRVAFHPNCSEAVCCCNS